MFRLVILTCILWLFIFLFRIYQIGGLDPTFRDQEATFLLPLRNYLSQKLDAIMPYPQSALLSGIILGTSRHLPNRLKQQLKDTGTIHMVVVSGQNLTILAGFFLYLVYVVGRGKTILITLLAIIFYSLLTGLGVPVIRAAIMAGVSLIGQIMGKERTGWWILILSASIMLLYQPNWILSLSFLLSFAATFGVVVIAPILMEKLKIVPILIKQDLAVSISAYLMTLPLIAYNFSNISLVAILVNILILWVIPIVMVTGFAAILISIIDNTLGLLFGLVPTVLLTYFIYLVEFFSQFSFSSINLYKTSWLMWAGYYLGLGSIVLLLTYDKTTNS